MEKHDKTIATSSEEFLQNRINDLEKRLAFADGTIKELQEQCSRMSKWASEIEANAKDITDAKDEYIKSLEETIVTLAVGRTQK